MLKFIFVYNNYLKDGSTFLFLFGKKRRFDVLFFSCCNFHIYIFVLHWCVKGKETRKFIGFRHVRKFASLSKYTFFFSIICLVNNNELMFAFCLPLCRCQLVLTTTYFPSSQFYSHQNKHNLSHHIYVKHRTPKKPNMFPPK